MPTSAHAKKKPSGVISVGDWLEGDVIAATEAGLRPWIDRGVEPFTGDEPHSARTIAADLTLHRMENLEELSVVVERSETNDTRSR